MVFWGHYAGKLAEMAAEGGPSPAVPVMVVRYEDLCLNMGMVRGFLRGMVESNSALLVCALVCVAVLGEGAVCVQTCLPL